MWLLLSPASGRQFKHPLSLAGKLPTGFVSRLLSAESESVEDASYGPVCRLAPADSRRSLCSPEVLEPGLRSATAAATAVGDCSPRMR
jgi:hypothetical protein